MRRRYVQCPLPTCPTSKRRVKRLRPLPNKWNEIPTEIRTALETEFQVNQQFRLESFPRFSMFRFKTLQIGQDINKCCSTCCNRINRKLAVLSGHPPVGPTEVTAASSDTVKEETNPCRTEDSATSTVAPTAAAAPGTKEGSSTSSGDEDLVVEEKPVQQLLPPHPMNMMEPRPVARIIQPADNSETDSADEMGASSQNAAAEAQAANANHPSVSQRSNGNIGQVRIDVMQPPKRMLTGSVLQEALTVRDLVSGVIESQLKRADPHGMSTPLGVGSPVYPPGPSESPTITSILKDSQRNYVVGRSSAPLTIVTNSAPAPSPRLMMTQPPEPKQQTILVIDPSSAVNYQIWLIFKKFPSMLLFFIAASRSPTLISIPTARIGYGSGPS